jgi:hypothetical protein
MADGEALAALSASGGGLPDPGTGTSGTIRLHHGTDLASANDIALNGLDGARAAAFNGSGEFWATVDVAMADTFAQVNPAGGPPARLDFDLPVAVLVALLTANPPRAYQHGPDVYELLPAGFPSLNAHMIHRQVVSPVP